MVVWVGVAIGDLQFVQLNPVAGDQLKVPFEIEFAFSVVLDPGVIVTLKPASTEGIGEMVTVTV